MDTNMMPSTPMPDEFDKKRELIQLLLDMLKKSAGDEMNGPVDPMAKPEGDMPMDDSMGKPPMPEDDDKDEPTPEMDKMAMGGMPGADVPKDKIEMQDDENNSSVFPFQKRKK